MRKSWLGQVELNCICNVDMEDVISKWMEQREQEPRGKNAYIVEMGLVEAERPWEGMIGEEKHWIVGQVFWLVSWAVTSTKFKGLDFVEVFQEETASMNSKCFPYILEKIRSVLNQHWLHSNTSLLIKLTSFIKCVLTG